MNKISIVGLIVLVPVLIAISWNEFSVRTNNVDATLAESNSPALDEANLGSEEEGAVQVNPGSFDFGVIVQSEGDVSTVFMVRNSGEDELIINRLSTSCGCTSVKMNQDPLQPGEEREMVVTFDPLVHPDQFGEIQRVVYLQTSDPLNPEIAIDITGNVIK